MMRGMVAAGDAQSAQAGAEILRQGGNAIDAAVAAAFAAFVAETVLVNSGGGGYGLVVAPNSDSPKGFSAKSYDFTCTMPSKKMTATSDFHEVLVDFGDEVQPFHVGRASSAVPGAVAGLCAMLADGGYLPLKQVIAPAVRLAEHGITLSRQMATVMSMLLPIFRHSASLEAKYTDGGKAYSTGAQIRFPELAQTLAQLGEEGPDFYYRGLLAQEIANDHHQFDGLITYEDLCNYRVETSYPLEIPYRDHLVLLPPPSSQGGLLIGFSLMLLDKINIERYRPGSPNHARILAEAMRLTNVARKLWDESNERGKARLDAFFSQHHVEAFTRELQEVLHLPPATDEPPQPRGAGNTSHISSVDEEGRMVSMTTSAGEGGGYLVGDTGILLNNFLGESDLNPNGFHKFKPGSRIMSMMSPAIVIKDKMPFMAVGSAGSNRLRSAILQVVNNVIDHRFPIEDAIKAPRIHYESGVLHLEGGTAAHTVDTLKQWGYQVRTWGSQNVFFGGAQAVIRVGDCFHAAGDPRRGGSIARVD